MGAFWTAIRTVSLEPGMFIQNTVTSLNVLLVLRTPGRRDFLREAARFLVLFLLLNVLNALWETALHLPGACFVTHFILLMGYAWYRRLLPGRAAILTVFLFYAIETAVIALSAVFMFVFPGDRFGVWPELLLRNGVVLSTLLFAWFFHKHSLLRFRNVQRVMLGYGILISCVTLFLSVWFIFFTRPGMDTRSGLFVMLAFAGVLALDLVACYLTWAVCVRGEREKELLAENYSIKSGRYMLELSQKNLEEMRKLRHDIKNHFSYIRLLNRERRQEELDRYLAQLADNWIEPLTSIDCGNRCLSSVLNLELAKARAKGFSMDCRVIVPPELPFADVQLCSLLTNIIDNAIEACERNELAGARIDVGINQRGSSLYICVLNPLPEGAVPELITAERTSKPDTQAHGYGKKIIRSIVREYNGQMVQSADNGRFRVDVMLDMLWDIKENGQKEARTP